jgi:hypothetical protein
MTRIDAFLYLIACLAAFAVFTWVSYRFMVFVFKMLNRNK